jgi:hypothetical protein
MPVRVSNESCLRKSGIFLGLPFSPMPNDSLRGVPSAILSRLRLTCLELPGVREERAWTGTRWSIGKRNFAHVLMIEAGWPPAYARAARISGSACVLTFRLARERCAAERFRRRPFFRPAWFPNIVGVTIDPKTDWDEIEGLIRESYRVLAPKKLAAQVE